MKRARLLRWAVVASEAIALALGVGAVGRGEPAAVLHEYRSFGLMQPVKIAGYSGDAMEPFLARDGCWLLFNRRNGPREQTDLMVAQRIDDRHFAFVGPLAVANSAALDAQIGETQSYQYTANNSHKCCFSNNISQRSGRVGRSNLNSNPPVL